MGMLIEGEWVIDDARFRNAASGHFVRPESAFRDRISRDGATGYAAACGRYHLLVSMNCPWAHRTVIARRLKGLDEVVDVSYATGPSLEHGWPFGTGVQGGPRPVDGVLPLYEVYRAARPGYSGRVTVPTLWDRERRTIVNNESADIVRMFDTEFAAFDPDAPALRPRELAADIDAVNDWVYPDINNGVYRCGFATTQAAYETACRTLFAALDRAEAILGEQRYLVGSSITEADVRLFPTLVRFDAVYHGLFKCNLKRLADYPNLSGYTRALFQTPGFGDTCDLQAIQDGYYRGIRRLNPHGIVPLGPTLDFTAPHDRG